MIEIELFHLIGSAFKWNRQNDEGTCSLFPESAHVLNQNQKQKQLPYMERFPAGIIAKGVSIRDKQQCSCHLPLTGLLLFVDVTRDSIRTSRYHVAGQAASIDSRTCTNRYFVR